MTQRKFNVKLAKRAEKMLLAHTKFIAQVNLSAARRLVLEFKKIEARLTENPYQFPYADELDVPGIPPETYRKCLFDGRYKALILIEEHVVFIDAVIDCRQENSSLYD